MARDRLRRWIDTPQISARIGYPIYANPGELRADIEAVLGDEDYVRVSGAFLCPCGRQANEHQPSILTDEAGDTLRRLCDGRLVKT